jgi:hypothetical protein
LGRGRRGKGDILLAGLAQVGRHLDVVLRDAVVVVINNLVSRSRKLKFVQRLRFRASGILARRCCGLEVKTLRA